MIRCLITHWLALRALEKAERSLQFGGAIAANEILNISQVDQGELSSHQASRIYRDRTVREAVIMQLIQVGSFWLHQSRHAVDLVMRARANGHYKIVVEAAVNLSVVEHTKETDHRELIVRLIQQDYQQQRTYRGLQ